MDQNPPDLLNRAHQPGPLSPAHQPDSLRPVDQLDSLSPVDRLDSPSPAVASAEEDPADDEDHMTIASSRPADPRCRRLSD